MIMTATVAALPSEWLTVKEAAARAKVSANLIYLNIKQGRLRASRLGARKDIRILASWVDAWIMSLSVATLINPDAPGEDMPGGPIAFNRRGPKGSR